MRTLLFILILVQPGILLAEPPVDLLITSGHIVDGTGAPWYVGDVAIRDGRIVGMGRLRGLEAKRTLDATGLIVAPGFIDMMGQTASPLIEHPELSINLLTQGITTINCGEGASAAPLTGEAATKAGWSTMREYFSRLETSGLPLNVVQTVGHSQIRQLVIGDVDRRPSADELVRMKEHVREVVSAGAIGVSNALIYPPAVYASTEEIAALAQTAGESGGGYYTHMRNEGDRLLEAIDEALEIGQSAKCRVHIFHLKAAGRQNWGKMDLAIARIQAARANGQQVAADVYPYINNGLGMTAFIHPRHSAAGTGALRKKLDDSDVRRQIRREMEEDRDFENWYRHVAGDWDRVVLGGMKAGPLAAHNGQTIAVIAKATKRDPWDVFFDAAKINAFALPQSMAEANLIRGMQADFVSFCTDVGPAADSIAAHPRAFGAFPRALSRYVRDLGVLPLERAIARMSAVAANEVLQPDRGRLAPGLPADLVIFDIALVADKATFAEPSALSTGIQYVIVNGQLVLEGGKYTGAKPGRVLRGPGFKAP